MLEISFGVENPLTAIISESNRMAYIWLLLQCHRQTRSCADLFWLL